MLPRLLHNSKFTAAGRADSAGCFSGVWQCLANSRHAEVAAVEELQPVPILWDLPIMMVETLKGAVPPLPGGSPERVGGAGGGGGNCPDSMICLARGGGENTTLNRDGGGDASACTQCGRLDSNNLSKTARGSHRCFMFSSVRGNGDGRTSSRQTLAGYRCSLECARSDRLQALSPFVTQQVCRCPHSGPDRSLTTST